MGSCSAPRLRVAGSFLCLTALGCAAAPRARPVLQPLLLTEPPRPEDARATARLLGIEPLVDQLRMERPPEGAPPLSLQELAVRLQVRTALDTAALAIEQVAAHVEAERSTIGAMQSAILARQRGRLQRFGVGAVSFAVVAAVADVMQAVPQTARAGAYTIAAASVLGAGLALWELFSPGPTVAKVAVESAMLTPIVDPTQPHPHYPAIVWMLLESAPAREPAVTRRQALVRRWEQLGLLGPEAEPTPGGRGRELVAPIAAGAVVDFDLLDSRRSMLGELLAVILQMKEELVALGSFVPAPAAVSPPGRTGGE